MNNRTPRPSDHRFYFARPGRGDIDPASRALRGAAWTPWEAGAVVAAFILSQIGLALLAASVLRATGWGRIHLGDPNALLAVALPVAVLGSHVVGWAGALTLVRAHHRLSFVTALALTRVPLRRLASPFAGGAAVQVVVVAAIAFMPPPPDYEATLERFFMLGLWAKLAMLVLAGVLAPLVEEVLFRGLLLTAFRRHLRFAPAALAVTAVFTSLHMVQVGAYLPALVGIFACGYLLAWLRERRGSLWPSIAFHMGFNLAALLPLLLV